jgi:hypothetical protein
MPNDTKTCLDLLLVKLPDFLACGMFLLCYILDPAFLASLYRLLPLR